MSPKRKWWLWALVFVALLAVLAIFLKGYLPGAGDDLPDEDSMPAIKVVVVNGCGYVGLASEYEKYIMCKNIEVLRLENTRKPLYDKSIIVVKKEDKQDLERLKKMTGIQRWTMALNEHYDAPFIIILGRDYEEFIK
ncbi:MAG: LytR C-terminal domain-containing protein [Candidatus Cloacimonadaceae bacterium]|nr:LytR C-terminal domain-containing protein [Candidatus Cloacimonadaceae bacterium]MDP3115219.1 LytR C-terminal domain-containing protein [Candidatus Cloacimonadaceae bacterium]